MREQAPSWTAVGEGVKQSGREWAVGEGGYNAHYMGSNFCFRVHSTRIL